MVPQQNSFFNNKKGLIILVLWLFGWKIAINLEIGMIFFSITAILFIFLNLGSRQPGTLSAYSVFNKNYEKILGTLDENIVETMLGRKNNF